MEYEEHFHFLERSSNRLRLIEQMGYNSPFGILYPKWDINLMCIKCNLKKQEKKNKMQLVDFAKCIVNPH